MKNILILFLCSFLGIYALSAQNFQCIKETTLTPEEINAIRLVYSDYIERNKVQNKIVDIQYLKQENNDSSKFMVIAFANPTSLLNKPVDCFGEDSSNIIFLYTKNYQLVTDTIWLNAVYEKAKQKLGIMAFTEIVNWENKEYRHNKPNIALSDIFILLSMSELWLGTRIFIPLIFFRRYTRSTFIRGK